jgi:transposase/DNA-binding transcriptional MerR regulator
MILMNVFQTIQKHKKQGMGIREISRRLGIARKTVRKYYEMSSEQYAEYALSARNKPQAFDSLRDEIIDIYQHNERKVYVSSVYDLLEEKYGSENLPGTARTLRNYISRLIKSGEIERTANRRFYAPVEELPFGKQLQVDFGETVIETGERIYIFASVLSASRFRYVAVQNRPFKTLDVVLHLLDCFEYIGGIPEEIVIDQDSTLVVSENHGDILLTKGFTQFKEEMGFRLYVCRKADPESKGKVENLVKFVKTSFFSARRFRTLESVRKSLQSWLVRTANGKISQATGRIPRDLLGREQEALAPLRASLYKQDTILDRQERLVDDKSFISVAASRYSVPQEYRNKRIWIYRTDRHLIIYESLAGKEIARHQLSTLPRQTVANRSHFRDRSYKQEELKEALIKRVASPAWQSFVQRNYRRYQRYFRDQHEQITVLLDTGYDCDLLEKALELCADLDTPSAAGLKEAYAYVQGVAVDKHSDVLPSLVQGIRTIKSDRLPPKVAKRDLSFYHSLISIVGGIL